MRDIADNSKCLIPDSSTGQHPSNVYIKKRTDVKFHIDFLTKVLDNHHMYHDVSEMGPLFLFPIGDSYSIQYSVHILHFFPYFDYKLTNVYMYMYMHLFHFSFYSQKYKMIKVNGIQN